MHCAFTSIMSRIEMPREVYIPQITFVSIGLIVFVDDVPAPTTVASIYPSRLLGTLGRVMKARVLRAMHKAIGLTS